MPTKHYYIEGERICTKIGGGFGLVAPLPPLDTAGTNTISFAAQLWTMVRRGFECDGNKVNDISILPGFSAINNSNNLENYRYYYHPDHIGSSSFITNQSGNVIEHLQYMPYGENFISQRSGRYDTPYKFSGKEKDEETQYSYFGARYYDSDLSIWLSVDPLAGKYPSLSPYNYCANNPIKFIDPDGEKITFGFFAFREKQLFNRLYRSADADTKAKYDELISSNVNYRINFTKFNNQGGATTYNFDKDRVDININRNANNIVGALGDELETAYQYEKGDIGFVLANNGTVRTLGYDENDECGTKRAEIKATEAVNLFEGINIKLDKTTEAFKQADTGPITPGMTRDQMLENYFNTDPSAKQYLKLFQPPVKGVHTGGANMSNKISGTGGYTIDQLNNAKKSGSIRDYKYNGK